MPPKRVPNLPLNIYQRVASKANDATRIALMSTKKNVHARLQSEMQPVIDKVKHTLLTKLREAMVVAAWQKDPRRREFNNTMNRYEQGEPIRGTSFMPWGMMDYESYFRLDKRWYMMDVFVSDQVLIMLYDKATYNVFFILRYRFKPGRYDREPRKFTVEWGDVENVTNAPLPVKVGMQAAVRQFVKEVPKDLTLQNLQRVYGR